MSFPGRLNIYCCDECDATMVTVDRDEGDTPYFTRCRRLIDDTNGDTRTKAGECGGRAGSRLYDVDQTLTPTWEWFKPTETERLRRRGWERWQADHGILLLRPYRPSVPIRCDSPGS